MAIAPFPHRYIVSLDNDRIHALPRESMRVGPPPQFGGTDDVWSPEDLLVAAVLTCFKTTFDAFARRDSLDVRNWRASGTGVLDKGKGGPVFTEIAIHVSFETTSQEADARKVLAVAERNCILTRTVTCPVHVEASVLAAPDAGEQERSAS